MWINKFFKKEERVSLEWLGTDMHSHLIAGIDDGAPHLDVSVQLVKGFIDLGYKKLITTPHILWEMYPNTPERIGKGLNELQQETGRQGLPIETTAAAEYFIDEHFVQQLNEKKPLLTLKDNLVLVEISTVTAPFDFQEVLFEMQMQNYQPVIAHPERYIYLKNNKSLFDDLKNAGYFFQLNLLSLIGHYGVSVQELAEYLIKKEYYDYAGSDVHHVNHFPLLRRAAAQPQLQRLKESGCIKNHLL